MIPDELVNKSFRRSTNIFLRTHAGKLHTKNIYPYHIFTLSSWKNMIWRTQDVDKSGQQTGGKKAAFI